MKGRTPGSPTRYWPDFCISAARRSVGPGVVSHYFSLLAVIHPCTPYVLVSRGCVEAPKINSGLHISDFYRISPLQEAGTEYNKARGVYVFSDATRLTQLSPMRSHQDGKGRKKAASCSSGLPMRRKPSISDCLRLFNFCFPFFLLYEPRSGTGTLRASDVIDALVTSFDIMLNARTRNEPARRPNDFFCLFLVGSQVC